MKNVNVDFLKIGSKLNLKTFCKMYKYFLMITPVLKDHLWLKLL